MGTWPRSEQDPLELSNVNVDILGGKLSMQQLRMPQHQPALLRLQNISSSELISAIKSKNNLRSLARLTARYRYG